MKYNTFYSRLVNLYRNLVGVPIAIIVIQIVYASEFTVSEDRLKLVTTKFSFCDIYNETTQVAFTVTI